MAKTAILAIKIISDATKAAKGMQQTETAAERMGRRMQTASRVAKVGLIALGAAAFGAAKAAAADEHGQAILAQALKNSAGARKADIAATEKWIDKTQRATGIADDQLRPALVALVGATHNVAKAQQLASLAMDTATRTGKPLSTVSKALANAYAGNTGALGKLVPGISKAVLKSGDFNKIQKELAATVGGATAKAAQTNQGKVARMSIAYGELQEQLGGFLLPILSTLAILLGSVAAFVQRNSTTVAILAGVLGTLAISVIAINTAYKSYKAITQAVRTAQLALNVVLAANPIGLIIIAVIALVAGLVLLYKHSSRFRTIVQAVGHAGQVALGWIVDKAKAVGQWLGKLGPAANKAKDIAVKAFKLYISPITGTIDLIKKLVGWISKIHFPSIPKGLKNLAGKVGLGGPPAAHSPGGRVVLGGRGGPGGAGGFVTSVGGNRAGGTVIYITVQGAVDKEGTARTIRDLLRGSDIRNGRKPVTV